MEPKRLSIDSKSDNVGHFGVSQTISRSSWATVGFEVFATMLTGIIQPSWRRISIKVLAVLGPSWNSTSYRRWKSCSASNCSDCWTAQIVKLWKNFFFPLLWSLMELKSPS